jgi:tryptophanyl-tRNA synthetase
VAKKKKNKAGDQAAKAAGTFSKTGDVMLDNLFSLYSAALVTLRLQINNRNPQGIQVASQAANNVATAISNFLADHPDLIEKAQENFQKVALAFSG